jgi:hypothetical protein
MRRLHDGDCPMTNSEPASRTGCVCEDLQHRSVVREYIEGGGGRTVWEEIDEFRLAANDAEEDRDVQLAAADTEIEQLRGRIRKLELALGRAGVALSRAGDLAEYSVAFAVLEGNYTALDAKEG